MSLLCVAVLAGQVPAVLSTVLSVVLPSAWALDRATNERLSDLEAETVQLRDQVEGIRQNYTERVGLIGVAEAQERYQKAVYHYLIGEPEPAALSFHILVQSRALGTGSLSRDSDWYLGETLFEMGNTRTAAEAYERIVTQGSVHPFFSDAVRRTMESFAVLGDTASFQSYYNNYIVTGKVPSTDLITYSLARSFYIQGQSPRAVDMFNSLPPNSEYYSRARYFLGVIAIQKGDLAGAALQFEAAQGATVINDEQRRVQELSWLALGSLNYEAGKFSTAASWYVKIGADSPLYADQLYQSVWTAIKQEQYGDALQLITVFLLRFPDHRYTASMRLLQARLQMETKQYEAAQVAFEEMVLNYEPVVTRLRTLAESPTDVEAVLVAQAENGSLKIEGIPGYAQEILLQDDVVARATRLYEDVYRQEADLRSAETVIQQLEAALGSGDTLGVFVTARTDLNMVRSATLTMRSRLIEAQANYLKSNVSSTDRTAVMSLSREAQALIEMQVNEQRASSESADRRSVYTQQVQQVQQEAGRLAVVVSEAESEIAATLAYLDAGKSPLSSAEQAQVRERLVAQQTELRAVQSELTQLQSEEARAQIMGRLAANSGGSAGESSDLEARYNALWQQLSTYRRNIDDNDAREAFSRLDKLWADVDALSRLTNDVDASVRRVEDREISAVRERLIAQKQEVSLLQTEVSADGAMTRQLAVAGMQQGLVGLEATLMEQVLEADMGLVDVYWVRKLEASSGREELLKEQAKVLSEIDEQYRLVRENLEP